MSKKKKDKSEKKKHFKTECCEKYLKKGEHKRCKRCPSLDLPEAERLQRLQNLQIEIDSKD